jgi:hypothetical protein
LEEGERELMEDGERELIGGRGEGADWRKGVLEEG